MVARARMDGTTFGPPLQSVPPKHTRIRFFLHCRGTKSRGGSQDKRSRGANWGSCARWRVWDARATLNPDHGAAQCYLFANPGMHARNHTARQAGLGPQEHRRLCCRASERDQVVRRLPPGARRATDEQLLPADPVL